MAFSCVIHANALSTNFACDEGKFILLYIRMFLNIKLHDICFAVTTFVFTASTFHLLGPPNSDNGSGESEALP